MNPGGLTENRAEVMAAGNLLEFFCRRTAEDFRLRARQEVPGLPWLGMGGCVLLAAIFYAAGQAAMARIFFGLLVLQTFWTIWVLVVRSGSQVHQQAEDVARGHFTAETAPLVTARLRWWNHLISPRRWARHSRIHGRRVKLQKKVADLRARLAEREKNAAVKPAPPPPALPPHLRNRVAIEERLQNAQRNPREEARLREELQVYEALLEQADAITEKLERIAALDVTIREGPQADLTQVVTDAMTVLEERRELVREVDAVDPDEFINLLTV